MFGCCSFYFPRLINHVVVCCHLFSFKGSGLSSIPDKLSEKEVKSITGEHFSQYVFDSVRNSDGFITREQLMILYEESEAKKVFTVTLAHQCNLAVT